MITIRRMWDGGPLRQVSTKRVSNGNWTTYESPGFKGYAGTYVCDICQRPVEGLYRATRGLKWACGACK